MQTPKAGVIRRKIGSLAWAANQTLTFDIPRMYDLWSVVVEITGTFQLTTAATTVSALAPAQLLKRIDIMADGNRQFDQMSGIMAAWGNWERKLARSITAPGTGIATHPVYCQYVLDRITADAFRPKDSALHTNDYMSLLQCRIVCGTIQECYSTFGAGVIGAITLTVNVYVEELEEKNLRDAHEPRLVKRVSLQEIPVTASATAMLVPLPVGSFMRGVKLASLVTATKEPSNSYLNNVKIRSGVKAPLDLSWASLREANKRDYGPPGSVVDALLGFGFADLIPDGNLRNLFDTRPLSECFLELDVLTGTTLLLNVVEYAFQPWHPKYVPAAKTTVARRAV